MKHVFVTVEPGRQRRGQSAARTGPLHPALLGRPTSAASLCLHFWIAVASFSCLPVAAHDHL